MANQYLTVTQAIARVRDRADIVGMTDRHPAADIALELNLSFQCVRELVSSTGVGIFLEPTPAAALTTTPAVTSERYVEIDWPTNFTAIYRVDVLQGGEWYTLKPADLNQMRPLIRNSMATSYGWAYNEMPPNAPFWYTLRKVPQASAATPTVGKIMLYPTPSAGMSYRLWGLESWVYLSETPGTDVFPGHTNWHDWMIDDTAIKRIIKDNNAQGTLQGLQLRQAQRTIDIEKQCRMLLADGPISPVPRRDGRREGWGPRMIP